MWHFFIISSASLTKNKVSKRTFAADAKAGSLYPPPGHKSCVIPRDIDEDASQNRNSRGRGGRGGRRARPGSGRRRGRQGNRMEEEDEVVEDEDQEEEGIKFRVLTLGGAYRQSCKLWEESSRPVESTFTINDDDIMADDQSSQPTLTGRPIYNLLWINIGI